MSASEGFQDYSNLTDDLFTLFDCGSTAIGVNLSVYTQTTGAVQAAGALESVGREATLAGGALAVGGQMSAGDRVLFASAVTSGDLRQRQGTVAGHPQGFRGDRHAVPEADGSGPAPAGAGPLPDWAPAIAAQPSASVFSLTGRHRLAAGLAGDGDLAPDPWPAISQADRHVLDLAAAEPALEEAARPAR